MSTHVPVSRFTKSPLEKFNVATLRRWYFSENDPSDPTLSAIHRYAIYRELESRDYPVHDWPVEDPFVHFTTKELRMHFPCDLITAHAIRDEINHRGEVRRASKDAISVGISGQATHRHGFAAC